MGAIFIITSTYLIGSIPIGLLIGHILRGIDIRDFGSGNIGATNTFRILGPLPGFTTLILDMFKGFLAVSIARVFLPDQHIVHILAGFAVISGHNWSIFLNFKGGKGVATAAGVFLGILTLPTIVAISVFAIVLSVSRYVSLASMSASVTLCLAALVLGKPAALVLFTAVICILIFIKHIPNIKRLRAGNENRLDMNKLLEKLHKKKT